VRTDCHTTPCVDNAGRLETHPNTHRALLCGAGRSMREGCAHGLTPAPFTGCVTTTSSTSSTSGSSNAPAGQLVVELPYSAQQLSALLEVLYEHRLNVSVWASACCVCSCALPVRSVLSCCRRAPSSCGGGVARWRCLHQCRCVAATSRGCSTWQRTWRWHPCRRPAARWVVQHGACVCFGGQSATAPPRRPALGKHIACRKRASVCCKADVHATAPTPACALQFLRSALSPETAVDVLTLAHHYHCSSLQEEGVSVAGTHC
jgi:hypothetical protein